MYSPTQQFLIYSGLFFAALVFSLLINSVFMRFARTLGMRDEQQTLIRWSSTAKPSLGGIGFYILFLACFSPVWRALPGAERRSLPPGPPWPAWRPLRSAS
jgi:UDP-N-acetylmuramyl pentapeptide phosphotransferase/UDP-N-acetylglucosamine-1-phosphate transferase